MTAPLPTSNFATLIFQGRSDNSRNVHVGVLYPFPRQTGREVYNISQRGLDLDCLISWKGNAKA